MRALLKIHWQCLWVTSHRVSHIEALFHVLQADARSQGCCWHCPGACLGHWERCPHPRGAFSSLCSGTAPKLRAQGLLAGVQHPGGRLAGKHPAGIQSDTIYLGKRDNWWLTVHVSPCRVPEPLPNLRSDNLIHDCSLQRCRRCSLEGCFVSQNVSV